MRNFVRSFAACAGWAACALMPLWAWYAQDPHLLPLRPWGVPLLVATSLMLLSRARRLYGIARWLCVWLVCASAVAGMIGEVQFRLAKHTVLDGGLPAVRARALAPHFIVGFRDFDALRPLLARGLVDGVFITQRNVAGLDAAQIAARIAQWQALRREAGLPPLIIATDQEGGPVSRLSPPLPFEPPLASLLASDAADVARRAEAYGLRQGNALAALGVTVDFSPVVDLKQAQAFNLLDTHTQIASRAIAADPQLVSDVALAYGRGLARAGVAPTLKHFPGLGGVRADTHHFSAVLDTPVATLASRDWLPFRRAAAPVHGLIMLGHVTLPALDPDMPVSLSRKVVQGVIRDTWHHQGVLVTDDLSMEAAYGHGLCNAVKSALNAGVDLLLISYDDEKIYPALDCVARALENGQLDAATLADSTARLAAWRMHWPRGTWETFPDRDEGKVVARR